MIYQEIYLYLHLLHCNLTSSPQPHNQGGGDSATPHPPLLPPTTLGRLYPDPGATSDIQGSYPYNRGRIHCFDIQIEIIHVSYI